MSSYRKAQLMKLLLWKRKQDLSQQWSYSFRTCSKVKVSANHYREETMKEKWWKKDAHSAGESNCMVEQRRIQMTLESQLQVSSLWSKLCDFNQMGKDGREKDIMQSNKRKIKKIYLKKDSRKNMQWDRIIIELNHKRQKMKRAFWKKVS